MFPVLSWLIFRGILAMSDSVMSDDLIKKAIPLGRAGTGDDMAGLTLYLASKVCSPACKARSDSSYTSYRLEHMSMALWNSSMVED